MPNRDPDLCAYCGCPLTNELDVNHSRMHDDQTDTDVCCPACAEGMRRFIAGQNAQTEEHIIDAIEVYKAYRAGTATLGE